MKSLPLAAALLFTSPLWSAYQYYLADSLTAVDNGKWLSAGTMSASSAGLAAADANGGSLISRLPIPDGSSEAEVRMTVRLAASGGAYTAFLQASPDARTGGASAGTFLAFEMQNPTFDAAGHCAANFALLQSSAGVASLLASFQHSCRDGMQ